MRLDDYLGSVPALRDALLPQIEAAFAARFGDYRTYLRHTTVYGGAGVSENLAGGHDGLRGWVPDHGVDGAQEVVSWWSPYSSAPTTTSVAKIAALIAKADGWRGMPIPCELVHIPYNEDVAQYLMELSHGLGIQWAGNPHPYVADLAATLAAIPPLRASSVYWRPLVQPSSPTA